MSVIMMHEMKFGWFDGGEDGEDNVVGLVEISDIFATHDVFLSETVPFYS